MTKRVKIGMVFYEKITIFILALLVFLSGCADKNNKKTVHVGVTGTPNLYSEYFEAGGAQGVCGRA